MASMKTWLKADGRGRRVWHSVTELKHFRYEWPNGRVDEGEEVCTLCYPNGLYLLSDRLMFVEADEAPGPVCKVCARKRAKEEADNPRPGESALFSEDAHAPADAGEGKE